MTAANYRRPPGRIVYPAAPMRAWLARVAAGESACSLAAQCGVGETTLRALLNGRTLLIGAGTADRIATRLGGHLSDVFEDDPVYQAELLTTVGRERSSA